MLNAHWRQDLLTESQLAYYQMPRPEMPDHEPCEEAGYSCDSPLFLQKHKGDRVL